jgi:hypothetical protein
VCDIKFSKYNKTFSFWNTINHLICTCSGFKHNILIYLEQGRTINGRYYAGELRRLRQEISQKVGQTVSRRLLLHDNLPAHTSQCAMAAATDCGFEILPLPLYSLNLAPLTFVSKTENKAPW